MRRIGRRIGLIKGTWLWVVRYHTWPSRYQRDFMSRSPRRQARVQAIADAVLYDLRKDES